MTGRTKCKGTDLAVDSKWVIVSFTMVMDEGSKMVSERKSKVMWSRYCGRRRGESDRKDVGSAQCLKKKDN